MTYYVRLDTRGNHHSSRFDGNAVLIYITVLHTCRYVFWVVLFNGWNVTKSKVPTGYIGAVCYLIIERDGGYNLIRIRYHDTVFNCLENIFLMTNAQFVGDDVTGDET